MADIFVNNVECTLDNIIIGSSFKMIESDFNVINKLGQTGIFERVLSKNNNPNLFYNVNENLNNEKSVSGLLEQNNTLNFCYFMKNNENIKLNSSYSTQYLNQVKENLKEEEIHGIRNKVFYDKTIQNLSSKSNTSYVQIKNKYYFINNNKFCNSTDDVISGKYELYPNLKPDNNLDGFKEWLNLDKETKLESTKDIIKYYISKKYKEYFYDDSLKVSNDKSIPIYDLDYDALENVDILKFQNSTIVDSIINYIDGIIISEKYKAMNYKKLSEIRDNILFNSKINQKNIFNYDSILIEPIIKEYLTNYEFENEDDVSVSYDLLSEIFNHLFINLSFDSFYRLLIPVGKINTIFNDKTSLIFNDNIKKGKASTKEIEEYTYYINVDNVKNLNDEIDFNYFYLKNFKNPHDEYDYEIVDINRDISCHTPAYSFSGSIVYKILNYVNSSLDDLKNYFELNHASVISGVYIENNNLFPKLMEMAKLKYKNWNEPLISAALEKEGTWLRYSIFNKFFKDTYNKNLSDDPYLISIKEVKDYWNSKTSSFKETFEEEMFNDSLLSSYYLSGLSMFNEIYSSISSIIAIVHRNEEAVRDVDKTDKDSEFIKSDDVITINKDLYELSETQMELSELYNSGLYKLLAVNVLNKNDVNDQQVSKSENWYVDLYKDRFSSKLNDYKNSFDYYYNHENIMKKDGYIYGYRTYKFINKSFTDKLFLTYNYFTSYDKNFLIRHNLENDILVIDSDNYAKLSGSATNWNNALNISGIINYAQKYVLQNLNKEDEFNAYKSMLLKIREFEFMDLIDGDFKYKETDVSKSNVYSIELKNSNLNYRIINFNEMMSKCERKLEQLKTDQDNPIINYFYNDNDESFYQVYENNEYSDFICTFIDLIHELGYKEILDITMNEDIELLKKTGFNIPITSYKFYNENDVLNTNIETKMEIRKQLEKAIRKSIGRYAPVNTTLWKIKYTGQ